MKKMKLVLWDIDGTLIESTPNPMSLHKLAIEKTLGVDLRVDFLPVPGMTDLGVIVETCLYNGLSVGVALQSQMISVLNEISLSLELPKYRPQTNAEIVLERLQELNVVNSIQTGNTETRAKKKLEKTNLLKFFRDEFSFYGSDSNSKKDLIPNRALRDLRMTFSEIFVVGDTTADIELGKRNRFNTIAFFKEAKYQEGILQLKPNFVIDDLISVAELVK